MEPRSSERGNCADRELRTREELASMEPRSSERGNRALSSWKCLKFSASMEPRSSERGNVVMKYVADVAPPGFNGAALI